jgi:CRP/FNR family transcriptional regulator, cyclic AMP receptor protein
MTEIYHIEDVPLFRNLPPDQRAQLTNAAERHLHKGGEAVFSHGDVPEFLYIVEHGSIDIVLPSKGEEIILASFEAGTFFGELAVFDKQPRIATARATQDTSLICIPLGVIALLIEEHPAAARQFISIIIQRLRSADELLSRLQIKNVNDIVNERMTFGEKIADLVARFGGSWTFIICFGVLLMIWMGVNTVYLLASPPDPYPYIFLNLILSCIAALQAPVIMMSQNRQTIKDRLQADQDFQINIKAEFAIQQLHRKLDELRAGLILHRHADAEQRRKVENRQDAPL